jgi:hypothetical protein
METILNVLWDPWVIGLVVVLGATGFSLQWWAD